MAKIFFQTHGCSTNISESEVMMGLLAKAGFEISGKEDADIIILNICTVKGESIPLREIRKITNKKLIIAGCITKTVIEEVRKINEEASLINTTNIKRICEVVEEVLQGNVVELLTREKEVKICLPKIRKNPIIGIVPILSGCNYYCSYCSVKFIKGRLFSYPKESIIKEVNQALNDNCKEIWITSMDNASYGLEKGKAELAELLKEIIRIEKEFFIRIGMMNPKSVKQILDGLIEIYKNNKVFKFLHLPLQSGDNDILKLMKRNYTVEEFIEIINEFKAKVNNLTLSTDIIVGFPTETEEQFNNSLETIKRLKPDIVNISRFQARQGTEASKMSQLRGEVLKHRSRLLTDISGNISRLQNEKWLGWQGNILIDEIGKNDSFIGRNFAYKPVIVKGNYKLGDIVKVKIEKATSYDLRA